MCNDEVLDAVREQAGKLVFHTDALRRKFNDIEEEFREGNLDRAELQELSRVIHQVESDSATFEKLLEA